MWIITVARLVLIATSVFGVLWMTTTPNVLPPPYRVWRANDYSVITIWLTLALNAIFLAVVRPARSRPLRIVRLFWLWLDAKEMELKARASAASKADAST